MKLRVYWVIFWRPDEPSFFSCCSCGIALLISCMMIDAEMYGITPSANSEKRSSAPPVNRLNTSTMVPCCEFMNCNRACGFTPGTGMKVPIR